MATASEITAFIQKLGNLAVKECNNRIAAGKGFVLPSVCIAQSAIETGWGTAGIMTRANAFFGIKAGGSWTGAVYRADTWEVADGTAYNTTANFRAYASLADSVRDYYDLIGNATRYANALSFGSVAAAWKSPRECITAIWSGGYATDTLYVEKIINTINARALTAYDAKITGEGSPDSPDAPVANLPIPSIIFKRSEMVQGSLILTDSARAISNNKEDLTAVALNWDSSVEIGKNTDFVINGIPAGTQLYVAYTTDTSAEIFGPYSAEAFNNNVLAFNASLRTGFYLKKENGGEFLLSELPTTFELSLINNALPGAVVNTGPLAYFVEIV